MSATLMINGIACACSNVVIKVAERERQAMVLASSGTLPKKISLTFYPVDTSAFDKFFLKDEPITKPDWHRFSGFNAPGRSRHKKGKR